MSDLLDFSLVLANFGEVFDNDSDASWLWHKATLVSDRAGYLLVAPSHPSNLSPELGAWCAPGAVIIPSRNSGRLCQDLLADVDAWHQVINDLRGRGPIRLWAQVFTPGVETVVEALAAAGLEVETSGLPRVSALTVRYWNTKIGGRDLLQSIAAVRRALPAAVTCNTLVEVLALIADTEADKGLVVKVDRSMGGGGIRFFPGGTVRRLEQIAASFTEPPSINRDTAKAKSIEDIAGPYLVEEMIGTPEANRSPTLDFLVAGDGTVQLVGCADQRLAEGARYVGAQSSPQGQDDRCEQCVMLGNAVCQELSRRGYRGFANLDFVIDTSGATYIAEMNLRQSAPLDQFLIMRRLFGDDWQSKQTFICLEQIPVAVSSDTAPAMTTARCSSGATIAGGRAVPLAAYGASPNQYASVLCLGASSLFVEQLAQALIAQGMVRI